MVVLTAPSVDRDDRRNDRDDGPSIQLHARRAADGAGTVQVPCALVFEGEDCQGMPPIAIIAIE